MSFWTALVLVSLCAVLWDIGIVLQKQAVDVLPALRMGRELPRALRGLVTSSRWMAGLGASAAGWGLFAWALSFTPVSLARAIQGAGFVILALFSTAFLRYRLSAAEWTGVALVTGGVTVLGIAGRSPGAVPPSIDTAKAFLGMGACLGAGAAAMILPRIRRLRVPPVVAVSIAAGILLGLGDAGTRAALLFLQRPGSWAPAGLSAAALVAFYVSGFLVLSRAYQHGGPVVVTAVSDLCARLAAIVMGLEALSEKLPAEPGRQVLTVLGFAAILVGAVTLSRFTGENLAASQRPGKPEKPEAATPAKVDADG